MSKFLEVALPLPIDKLFDYSVPERLFDFVKAGKRVWVPFGSRRMIGYIVSLKDKSDAMHVKDIEDVIDSEPMISKELFDLSKWMSEYYIASWGEVLHAMVPGALKQGQTSVKARKVEHEETYKSSGHLKMTSQQQAALDELSKGLDDRRHGVYLLYGITSSGKTEIYLQLIDRALAQGKSSIVLIPEISLTPQTIERFKSRFGDNVAVMHSRLLGSTMYAQYKRIKDGDAQVVIGPRSALFTPVKNLGVVVIDEEQEPSYKQDDTPRYHAREVAIKRAQLAGAVVVLGTATPSMESYRKAKDGEYRLLSLTKRIDDRPLPKVRVVDMRQEMIIHKRPVVISEPLKRRIGETISRGEQAMLFLNRRGFATYITCTRCGYAMRCKRCDVSLVLHSQSNKLVCHSCNYKTDPPNICPQCQGAYMRYFGKGTEKVESELHKYFPASLAQRMDTDTTKKRGSHDKILKDFKDKKANILIGTQMIAKGLDFPEVTLVGVISADVTLNLPDFRASERTFNLVTQVAGRAGRGKEPGEVIIQTYTPEHYAIHSSETHDYDDFYNKEIVFREELCLPPFYHIIKVSCRGFKEENVIKALEGIKEAIKAKDIKGLLFQGPAPAMIARARGKYNWHLLIKAKSPEKMSGPLKEILLEKGHHRGVTISVDVDPIGL